MTVSMPIAGAYAVAALTPADSKAPFIKSLLDVFEALADVYSREELRAMARSFHQDSKLKAT